MAKNKNKKPVQKKKPVEKKPVVVEQIPFYSGGGFWNKYKWQALFLMVLPFVLYYQATEYGFVLDDQIVLSENEFTKDGFSGIDDLLTTESMMGFFGEEKNLVQGNRYRPLSLITYAIEYDLSGGPNPWLHHFINILLYGLTGLLLFRVLSMMLRKIKPSAWWLAIPFLASLFYITHPIHSEAVANIKGRDEILALLLSLATLYTSLRYMDTKKIAWLGYSSILFFLALLSKENSITFLAVIPLTIYFFSDYKWRNNFLNLGVLLLTTGAYLALRFSVAGVPQFGITITDLMNNPFLEMNGSEKMATIMFTLMKYFQLYIFPHPLSHDYYPYAIPILGWGDIRAWGSLILHIVLAIWAIIGLRKKWITSYALLYYFATLSIVSNIVINLGTFMNERFIYMSSVGLALIAAYFISEKIGKWKGSTGIYVATALSAILLIGYSAKTFTRVPDWQSALTLNSSAVKYGTNSARANSFMATALYEEGKVANGPEKWELLEDAFKYSEKAIKIFPKYQNAQLMKAGIAAELYKKDRDEKLLLKRFGEVMEVRPDIPFITEYLEYLESRSNDLDYLIDWYVVTSLRKVMIKAKQPTWALHYINRAYDLDRDDPEVLEAVANIYNKLRMREKSLEFRELARQAELR